MRTQTPVRTTGLVSLGLSIVWFVAACAAPPPSETPTPTGPVDGLVRQGGLFPIAGVIVRAQGQTTLTDADGRFTLEDVAVPYDLSLSQTSGDGWLHVLEGLTDRTPVLDPMGASGFAGGPNAADVSGTLSGGGLWPLPAGRRAVVCVEGIDALVFGCDTLAFGDDTYDLTANMLGTSSGAVRIHGLRIVLDGGGRPIGYEGYGFADASLEAGVPSVVPLNLGVVPAVGDLEVAFDVPGGMAATGALVILRLGDGGSLMVYEGAVVGDALTVAVPLLPGSRYGVFAGVTDGSGTTIRWSVVDDLDGGTLDFAVPPQLTAPVAAATGVTSETAFEAIVAGSVPRTFRWTSVGGPSLALTTTRSSVALPDLASAGFAWPAGAEYTWNVTAYDAPTVDAAAVALDPSLVTLAIFVGLDVPDEGSFANADVRTVTLAP